MSKLHPTAEIHGSAVIGARVTLGQGVVVGPGAVIEDEVTIGPRCRIGPQAFIGRYTEMGPDNSVGLAAQVGGEPQAIGWQPAASRVVIGAGNTIREYVSIHRALHDGGETCLGDRCYLMGSSHVAHDCRLGDEVVLANGALLAGHVEVGDNAFISGNCVVHQFVRIGRRVMVRGLTALGKDVVPFVLVDQSNTVRALNKVGLRRAGFPREAVAELARAFRTIFRSGLTVSEAVAELEAGSPGAEVREMLDFIRASKRGICLTYSTQVRRLEGQAAAPADDEAGGC
jgi:UDP-N-acetylglucosamine acyltransferase